MTSQAKRKVLVTLDADLAATLEADGGTTLSAEVNSILRAEFTRRKQRQALTDLLDRPADERGGLDTPEDEAEIARYVRLLGGMTEESGELLRAGPSHHLRLVPKNLGHNHGHEGERSPGTGGACMPHCPAAYGHALHDTVTGRGELRDAVKRHPPAAVQRRRLPAGPRARACRPACAGSA